MFDYLRKTMSHAGIYAVGILLSRAVSFLMLPVYTRLLTPSDYGVMELLEVTVDIVSIVTGMGVVQGLFKFYYQSDGEGDRKTIVSTTFLLIIFAYGCVALAGAGASGPISSLIFSSKGYSKYVAISFLNLFLSFLIYVPLAYVRTLQRPFLFVAGTILRLVLQLSLNILLVVYLRMGVLGVLYSTMIASLVVGLAASLYLFGKVGLAFSVEKAKTLLKFGYPFIFSGLGAFILTYADRYFLNHYGHLSSVGIYSLGYKFGFLLMMFPVNPLFTAWMVQRFEIVSKDNYEEVFNKFLEWFVFVTLGVALFISLSIRDVLRIMSAPSFWPAAQIVPIILAAYFLQACTDFFNFGIYHGGATKHMAYGTGVAAIVAVALCFLLIPGYGVFGAAWATFISFLARLVYVYAASQRTFRIRYKLLRPFAYGVIWVVLVSVYYTGTKLLPAFERVYLSVLLGTVLLFAFLCSGYSLGTVTPQVIRSVLGFISSPIRTLRELRGGTL
jgi:O-antigen/teichoic acid export membrane protein